MAAEVGATVKPGEKTSLLDVMDQQLQPHLRRLEEISESASKEWSLEKSMDKQLGPTLPSPTRPLRPPRYSHSACCYAQRSGRTSSSKCRSRLPSLSPPLPERNTARARESESESERGRGGGRSRALRHWASTHARTHAFTDTTLSSLLCA
eukprot:2656553-Rhodomonas_salina.1